VLMAAPEAPSFGVGRALLFLDFFLSLLPDFFLSLLPHLAGDPRIGGPQSRVQIHRRLPVQGCLHQAIIATPATHAQGARDVAQAQLLAGNLHGPAGELVDGDHLLTADVERTGVGGIHQSTHAIQTIVDVEEGAVCSPSPQISISPPSSVSATLRHKAAGAFSRPPSQVPLGPKIL